MRDLPDSINTYLEEYTSTGDDLRTSSKSHVYFFRHADRRGRFLKVMNTVDIRPDEADLESERVALQWLQGQCWAPELVHYCQQDEIEYLITEAMPGCSSDSELLKADIPGLLSTIAHGLRRIHNLASNDFPRDGSVDMLLARLERLIRLNLLKPEDLKRVGWHGSPHELLDHMHKIRPQAEESVLTHGDYCLPNILVKDGQVTGIVDWGYAGLGDRHRDFAAAVKSICRNLGEEWVNLFFKEYGINELDRERLKYHRLLYDLT